MDATLYVMTSEFGSPSQLEKIDMLDFADFVAINKFDHRGADDALRDVRKQFSAITACSTATSTICPSTAPSPPSLTTTA